MFPDLYQWPEAKIYPHANGVGEITIEEYSKGLGEFMQSCGKESPRATFTLKLVLAFGSDLVQGYPVFVLSSLWSGC